ncbi:hypothetical protein [Streptomyces natalensis]|uniref:hypothetical protein n=1 Tax=Streptomyces natalensis TaxID=68242 RepID=UPI00099DCB2F|nr:hypothetical protein [Streptomyces natalensis]
MGINSPLSPHLSLLEGENPRHICALTNVQTALPPITVHRPTMRSVDGVHRLRAAALRGDDGYVEPRFVEGSAEGAPSHRLETPLAPRRMARCALALLPPCHF